MPSLSPMVIMSTVIVAAISVTAFPMNCSRLDSSTAHPTSEPGRRRSPPTPPTRLPTRCDVNRSRSDPSRYDGVRREDSWVSTLKVIMSRPIFARFATTGTALATLLAAGLMAPPVPVAPAANAAGPPVGHVWTIVLENSEFAQTFVAGRSAAPYLTQALPSLGKLVVQYYGTGHSSLDNYIAMTSGQGPNASTQGDCATPTTLGGPSGQWHFDADGQAVEDRAASPIGCTYP